jgi:hypothetical protein
VCDPYPSWRYATDTAIGSAALVVVLAAVALLPLGSAVVRWALEGSSDGEPDAVVEMIDSGPADDGGGQPAITLVNGDAQRCLQYRP